eukprot:TRINITY_DN4777_c0_g2_i1.p1 TRINITY_DN4777_c0_g2~~TRINITY_DN4777_c0_g2_i1.p1  ORF type:complete len:425 (-),score=94.62 TRINITY_DN4777_c0_g2_i1:65-1339(-)
MHAPSAPPVSATPAQAFAGAAAAEMRAVPAAVATAQLTGDESDTRRICNGLVDAGLPYGLARLVGEEDRQVGRRIFLLDNSGSTCSYDGKYLDPETAGGRPQMVTCTRWEEIRRMALQQARLNAKVGVPCEFVLLNPPSMRAFGDFRDGLDFVCVDGASGRPVEAQIADLERMLANTRPNGTTPLDDRLKEIHYRIQHVHHGEIARGSRFVVVVATDGLPTCTASNMPSDAAKRQVVSTLRKLTAELPVFVVVRLTTDEDDVVDYYNRVDEEEELPLEVIDDIESEAKEIRGKGNGWLTYSTHIHMLREGGTFVRLFDALDERTLNEHEAQHLTGQLLRRSQGDPELPRPPDVFLREARTRIWAAPLVYDPLRRRMAPFIDVRSLRHAMGLSLMGRLAHCCRYFLRGQAHRRSSAAGPPLLAAR